MGSQWKTEKRMKIMQYIIVFLINFIIGVFIFSYFFNETNAISIIIGSIIYSFSSLIGWRIGLYLAKKIENSTIIKGDK